MGDVTHICTLTSVPPKRRVYICRRSNCLPCASAVQIHHKCQALAPRRLREVLRDRLLCSYSGQMDKPTHDFVFLGQHRGVEIRASCCCSGLNWPNRCSWGAETHLVIWGLRDHLHTKIYHWWVTPTNSGLVIATSPLVVGVTQWVLKIENYIFCYFEDLLYYIYLVVAVLLFCGFRLAVRET